MNRQNNLVCPERSTIKTVAVVPVASYLIFTLSASILVFAAVLKQIRMENNREVLTACRLHSHLSGHTETLAIRIVLR